jgi:hypothetical protein
MIEAVASIGKPTLVSCGAADCETDHTVYEPRRILLLTEGLDRLDAEEYESVDAAVDQGTLVAGETQVFPTLLGYWWDSTHEPFRQN